jgi:hypothetical protein
VDWVAMIEISLDWVAMIEIILDLINKKSYKKLFLLATTWRSKILTA